MVLFSHPADFTPSPDGDGGLRGARRDFERLNTKLLGLDRQSSRAPSVGAHMEQTSLQDPVPIIADLDLRLPPRTG